MSAKKLISREEVLSGLGGRTTKQANTVLALIEQRTAQLVVQSQQVTDAALVVSAVPSPRQAFLRALADGRAALPPPSIQAIERFAAHWAVLAPENAEIRATVAHLLGQKYVLPIASTPGIDQALGLSSPAVQQAYQRLYNQPLPSIYAPRVTPLQQLRWLWAAFSARLEGLPPFWLTFFLTMPAVSGLLALPIALANVGPRWGVACILVFGLLNMLTATALAETVVRSGTARFGLGFLGQLSQEYLGAGATTLLTLALVISNFLVLIIFFLGVGGTLASATNLPAPLWMLLLLAAVLYFLSRKSLNATVTTNLLIVFVNLLIVLILLLLALPLFQLRNLTSGDGSPAFTPAAAGSIVGILSATFLSHFLVATYGPVILPRDPSGRAWQRGSMAAVATMTLIAVLWLLVLTGVLGPATLSTAKGTVVTPLAELVGPAVNVLGSLLVILSIGLATIQVSLAQYYSVEERLPARGSATWVGKLGEWQRFALSSSPMLLVLILAVWLLNSGVSSFASLLGTVNVLALPLLTGIIPPLLLVATRRMGDFAPGFILRWLGQPWLIGALVLFFIATILVHGLYIWDAWPLRLLGIGGALIIFIVALRTWRQAIRTNRVVITLRHDAQPQGQSQLSLVGQGQPLPAEIDLTTEQGQTRQVDAEVKFPDFTALRKIAVQLPGTAASLLKLWLHELSAEGLSSGLSAQVLFSQPGQSAAVEYTTTPEQSILTLPFSGDPCQVEIVLKQPGKR